MKFMISTKKIPIEVKKAFYGVDQYELPSSGMLRDVPNGTYILSNLDVWFAWINGQWKRVDERNVPGVYRTIVLIDND